MKDVDRSAGRTLLSSIRRMGRWLDRELPLVVKVALPGLIIVVTVAVWMGALLVDNAREHYRDAYDSAADHFAYMTQTQFEAAPLDRQGMVEFLGELREYTPDLAWVRVYRTGDPDVWASSEEYVDDEQPGEEHVGVEHEASVQTTDEILAWTYPLEGDIQPLGRIVVGIHGGREGVGVAHIRRDIAAALGLGLLAGGLALGALLYLAVLRRASRISKAATAAATGDIGVRLPEGDEPPSRDLLFTVARQFDRTLRAVELRTRQQAAVASLGQRALSGADVSELMEEAARLLPEGLEVELGSVVARTPEGLVLQAGHGWGEGFVGMVLPRDGQAGYTLATGGPVLAEDLPTETRFTVAPILREHGARSGVSVIIPGPEEPYGTLTAHTTRPRSFTHDDVHFVSSLATVLGAAIQRRRAREQLAAAEARYRTLVEHIPAITYTAGFGTAGRWEYVAPQIEGVLGYTAEEWMADDELWFKSIHPEDRDRVMQDEDRSVQSAGHLGVEYRLRTKEGRWRWLRDDAVVVRDEVGQPVFFQGVLYDVTDEKEAEEALRRAYDREREAVARLQSLDEMKNAFLSAVSHELRTPLAAVLGYAVTLQEAEASLSDDERHEAIDRLAVNARKLHRLLEDLLDLDRLARGIVDPRRQPVDVSSLALAALAEVDLGGREVETDAPPVVADLDGPKVERIIENLLVNAVKHSPPGTPIRMVVRREAGGVLIAVEDRGPGVPDGLKEDVFEPFVRGPERPAHSPGAGIGLSLVSRFAELHGGRAWIEDRPGGGASFRVFLAGSEPVDLPDSARGAGVPTST